MPKQDVNVKSYVRRGKLVRRYNRKQDKRDRKNNINGALKVAGVVASVMGITTATYLVLRKRYITNLNVIADSMKAKPNLGEVLDDSIKDMTFTIGGFGKNNNSNRQAEVMSSTLKSAIKPKERKAHFIKALQHNFSPNPEKIDNLISKDKVFSELVHKGASNGMFFAAGIRNFMKPLFKGKNDEAIKLAEEIYSYHVKNPTKPIKLYTFSAGTNLGRDVNYILNQKGVNNNLVTLGSADFGLLPKSNNTVDIVGQKDFVAMLGKKNRTYISDIKYHALRAYTDHAEVKRTVSNYFYKNDAK